MEVMCCHVASFYKVLKLTMVSNLGTEDKIVKPCVNAVCNGKLYMVH